jgi:iron complex outermembrane receptor protein
MKKVNLNFRPVLVTVLGLMLLVSPITAAAQTGETSAETLELESVTVTANKREENERKVPSSLTALTDTDIEDAGIESMDSAVEQVPGISLEEGAHGQEINFRGMSPSQFTGKNPMVVYMDGVPIESPYLLELVDFNEAERIEVLRGPQGALYGKNAIGGVINIITKKPGDEPEGKITAEAGEFGKLGLRAGVSTPVVDDLFYFGFSASADQSNGYLKNEHPDEEYANKNSTNRAKAVFRITPGDQLEIGVNLAASSIRSKSGYMIPGDDIEYEAYLNPDDERKMDSQNIALSIEYDFTNYKIISVTTYNSSYLYESVDYSPINSLYGIGAADCDMTGITQEIRLQSADDAGGIKWLAGGYFSDEQFIYNDQYWVYDLSSYGGAKTRYSWPGKMYEDVKSAFGQLTFPLGKQIELTGGLRYETIHKEMDYEFTVTDEESGQLLPYDPMTYGPSSVSYKIDDDWTAVLPKVALSWSISEDTMLYTSVADGYLAGGFNSTENTKEDAGFDPQKSRNYEIGAKVPLMNNRIFMDAAVYHIDITDIHVWDMSGPSSFKASNAGKAHSQGFEFEVSAKATEHTKVYTNLSQVNTEFDDFTNKGVDYAGNRIPRTPDNKVSLGASFRGESGIFAQMDAVRYGKTYYDYANEVSQDPYTLVHTKFGYESTNWDAYIQVRNLTNTKYAEAYSPDFSMMPGVVVGQPRTISLIASRRF